MHDENTPPPDPLSLDAVDAAIRANERAESPGGLDAHEDPSEADDEFLRQMAVIDSPPTSNHLEQLRDAGLKLPAPETLDDQSLTAELWRIIHGLAAQSTFLYHTDHLSDRELYNHLWSDVLREGAPVIPPGSGWVFHLDLIGGGSEDDIQIALRYYDTEEQRRRWANDFPKDIIPPHEDPPFDRDRGLPKAPELTPPDDDEAIDE